MLQVLIRISYYYLTVNESGLSERKKMEVPVSNEIFVATFNNGRRENSAGTFGKVDEYKLGSRCWIQFIRTGAHRV